MVPDLPRDPKNGAKVGRPEEDKVDVLHRQDLVDFTVKTAKQVIDSQIVVTVCVADAPSWSTAVDRAMTLSGMLSATPWVSLTPLATLPVKPFMSFPIASPI